MAKRSYPENSKRYRKRHPDRVAAYERSIERLEKKRIYAREYRKRKKAAKGFS